MSKLCERSSDYLYCIQSHPEYGFATGLSADSKQVLLGVYDSWLVVMYFDQDGILIHHELRPLSGNAGAESSDESVELESEVIEQSQAYISTQSSIHVRRFRLSLPNVQEESSPWSYSGVGIEICRGTCEITFKAMKRKQEMWCQTSITR